MVYQLTKEHVYEQNSSAMTKIAVVTFLQALYQTGWLRRLPVGWNAIKGSLKPPSPTSLTTTLQASHLPTSLIRITSFASPQLRPTDMASFKLLLFVAALLLVSVFAVPEPELLEYSIRALPMTKVKGMELEDANDGGIDVETFDEVKIETTERAPREKATFAVKKVETGFARTTNVGLTVQKGTAGIIKFRIRVKAVTAKQLAVKAKLFAKSLTKAQKKQLSKIQNGYGGGLDIPWLKFLGVDLSKNKTSRKDLIKARANIHAYDKLALKARLLLKDVVAQKIEVKGVLKAKGVSFIPTTVFSFIRIAQVHFADNSKLLVLSDHPGDVATASVDGRKVVPSEVESLKIL